MHLIHHINSMHNSIQTSSTLGVSSWILPISVKDGGDSFFPFNICQAIPLFFLAKVPPHSIPFICIFSYGFLYDDFDDDREISRLGNYKQNLRKCKCITIFFDLIRMMIICCQITIPLRSKTSYKVLFHVYIYIALHMYIYVE